jgi:DIS3-like exonuclease 1
LIRQFYAKEEEPRTTSRSQEFWVLTGDLDLAQRFPEEDGIRTILVRDFLEHCCGWFLSDTKLLDHAQKLMVRCEEEYNLRNATATRDTAGTLGLISGVQDYWSEDDILAGLRNKTLYKGRLTVSKENPKEGVVHSGDSSFFINERKGGYFNRALNQDIVIVQPLPKEEWSSPIGRRRLVHVRDDSEDDNDAMVDTNDDPPVPSGKVVAIVEESRRRFVATMVDTPMNDESAVLVVPMDIRIPKIRIKTNAWHRFVGHRLWVQIDGWEVGSTYPSGHCVDIIGPIADLEAEITCLLKENQIHLDPFSAAAVACLPLEGDQWKIPPAEIAHRRDLRSTHRIFSVDPIGCQDIDDTMHARVLSNGDIEIGVHIADVTYFLEHNSPLDKEAEVRGTTFYLVDRRFDMLPSLLSSDLCSLHGDVDRLAVSTIWTFSKDFSEIKDFWFGRTVIHNCQAMTYEQAHNILHDMPPDDPSKPCPPPLTAGYPVKRSNIGLLKQDLTILTNLARRLRKDREEIGGAVDLSSGDHGSELKFSLDEHGNPVRIMPKKQLEIHHTIAELMVRCFCPVCLY